MPRYIIKEGILDKFFGKIFMFVGKGAGSKALDALKFDPVLQKHAKELIKIKRGMKKHIESRKKRDPEYRKDVEDLKKSWGMS